MDNQKEPNLQEELKELFFQGIVKRLRVAMENGIGEVKMNRICKEHAERLVEQGLRVNPNPHSMFYAEYENVTITVY